MTEGIAELARSLGVSEWRVERELALAIRRSQPDAREVYGVINRRRFVARRAVGTEEWTINLEARRPPWESKTNHEPGSDDGTATGA